MTSKLFHRDVWVGAVLLAFCAASLAVSAGISGQASYLPVALSVLMSVCALFILMKGLRLTREMKGDYRYAMTVKDSKHAFLFMFFIFLYYLAFRYITYWIATPIFMILTQKYLKVKSLKVNLIITVSYIVLCYVVFVIILQLPIYRIGILGRFFRYV